MKTNFGMLNNLILLGLAFLSSCSSHPVKMNLNYSDPVVAKLMNEVYKKKPSPPVKFVIFEPQFEKTRAMYSMDEKIIYVDYHKWLKTSLPIKRLILLHEIGHALNLPHVSIEDCMTKPNIMCHSLKLVEDRYLLNHKKIESEFIKDLHLIQEAI